MDRRAFDTYGRLLGDPLLLIDERGEILAASRSAGRLLDRSASELEGERLDSLFSCTTCDLRDHVSQAARVSSPVPVSLVVTNSKESLRGDTARFSAAGEPVMLLMRLRPHGESVLQFSELRKKIEALASEIHSRRRSERLIESQRETLESILAGTPLSETFDKLLHSLEELSTSPMKASILQLDEEGRLRHLSAPSLPDAYNDAIDGLEPGPEVGSCGTAAFLNEPVIAADIETDPRWSRWKDLALTHDLRACWSTPIPSRTGSVLGTFAMYFSRRHATPSPEDEEVIALVSRTAAIAIENRRSEERMRELLRNESEARAEAERANRLKGEFLATVSHELRTPLTSILGWTRLVQGQATDPEMEEALTTIERSARAQAQLVDDLLDVSRLSLGKLKLDVANADLGSIIRSAISTVRPMADARQVRIELQMQEQTMKIRGDAQRLHQVIWNLLTNAIKFSSIGGTVTVRLEPSDSVARILVTDEGEGIDPEFLPRLFTRFSQADSVMTRSKGGLGLGLSIARDLLDLHGGTISAESAPGKGSTFQVDLPLPTAGQELTQPVKSARPFEMLGSELEGLNVLIVEDDRATRMFLSALIERGGGKTTLAESADAATVAWRRSHDVLICDLGLPGASGLELMKTLRDSEKSPRIAIAISAYVRQALESEVLSAGFDAFISKPIEPELLISEIRSRKDRGKVQ